MSDLLTPSAQVKTSDICAAMLAAYAQPEWALFFEVGNGTGSNCRRHADAVAMNMYPSRGLAIHGFEFKASKSDWKRELNDPDKAEAIHQYCDHWSLVTAPNIVGPGELPATWGLIEVVNGKLRTRVAAKAHDAKPITRQFFAALCRASAKADDAAIGKIVDEKVNAILEVDKRRRAEERRRNDSERNGIIEKHAAFAEFYRENHLAYTSEADFLKLMKATKKLALDSSHVGFLSIISAARALETRALAVCADLGIEVVGEKA